MFLGICLLLFVVLIVSLGDLVLGDVGKTPEYKQGFQDGYNEQNNTKYQAANEISSSMFGYTDEQYHYAKGYRAGYISFQNDNYSRAQAEKRNETARILGV